MSGTADVLIIGAGGHARVLLNALNELHVGVVAMLEKEGVSPQGADAEIDVLSEALPQAVARTGARRFVMGIGGTRDNSLRTRLYEEAKSEGLEALTVVHPNASVSASARIGRGCFVAAGCIVGPGASTGENVILNTASVIEHDVRIDDHVHVASGATLLGDVSVGRASHIGAASVILQGVRIGEEAVIGAGAVVLDGVASGSTVVGNPARAPRRGEA